MKKTKLPKAIQSIKFEKNIDENKDQNSLLYNLFPVFFLIFLIIGGSVYSNYSKALEKQKAYQAPVPSVVPAIVITATPIPTPKASVKHIPKPTVAPKASIDPNQEMVSCSINTNCGGGTRNITRSECNNQTCCQIGGKWYTYSSNQKCNEDQKTYWDNYYKAGSTNTYSPIPTYSSIPTSTPIAAQPTPQPTPYVDQAAIDARISQCKGDCIRSVDSYITSQLNSCRANGGSGSSYCLAISNSRNSLISSCQSSCY